MAIRRKLLELVEEALDQIAAAVDREVDDHKPRRTRRARPGLDGNPFVGTVAHSAEKNGLFLLNDWRLVRPSPCDPLACT